MAEYDNVVAFSATLKPFDYYRQLTGLAGKDLKTAEFVSPFPKQNRKLLIIPQISSKYSEREKSAPRRPLRRTAGLCYRAADLRCDSA